MTPQEFRKLAHQTADWMADYFEQITDYPVKARVQPGEILSALPGLPPGSGTDSDTIFRDFESMLLPGITHWQHPGFMAYFPANASYPSVLAEMVTSALGAQCMLWETSPAATELEQVVMGWLRDMTGLPAGFQGVIQDSASSSTLMAVLCAREKASGFQIAETGSTPTKLIVYGSVQTHSSAEKAVRIAGLGKTGFRKVQVREDFSLDPAALESAIREDLGKGFLPCAVIATLGTTGTTAFDPLPEIGRICKTYGLWLHVDAAYAGTAFLLPEFRSLAAGLDLADSYVFNPHKWMLTHFDCSAFFVRDPAHLVNVMSVLPDYLRTKAHGRVNNYSDWSIQLGRRFRALKLWWVIRSFGVDGLREIVRNHIRLAELAESELKTWPSVDWMAPRTLNLLCFRFTLPGLSVQEENDLNDEILQTLNQSGKVYLSQTTLNGKLTLRLVTGQTTLTEPYLREVLDLIRQISGQSLASRSSQEKK